MLWHFGRKNLVNIVPKISLLPVQRVMRLSEVVDGQLMMRSRGLVDRPIWVRRSKVLQLGLVEGVLLTALQFLLWRLVGLSVQVACLPNILCDDELALGAYRSSLDLCLVLLGWLGSSHLPNIAWFLRKLQFSVTTRRPLCRLPQPVLSRRLLILKGLTLLSQVHLMLYVVYGTLVEQRAFLVEYLLTSLDLSWRHWVASELLPVDVRNPGLHFLLTATAWHLGTLGWLVRIV